MPLSEKRVTRLESGFLTSRLRPGAICPRSLSHPLPPSQCSPAQHRLLEALTASKLCWEHSPLGPSFLHDGHPLMRSPHSAAGINHWDRCLVLGFLLSDSKTYGSPFPIEPNPNSLGAANFRWFYCISAFARWRVHTGYSLWSSQSWGLNHYFCFTDEEFEA